MQSVTHVSDKHEHEHDRTDRLLEVGDEVVPVLLLLETSERHFRTGNVLRGIE